MRAPVLSEAYSANDRVDLLRDGEEVYAAMLEAIRGARSTICLETYILRDDATGRRFAEALAQQARAGVQVNLLYDDWGSSVCEEFLRSLHTAGVRTLAFRPIRIGGRLGTFLSRLRKRDHRKILVVDSRVGFAGGLNIADAYASVADGGGGWRDTHVRIEGPAAISLQDLFLSLWTRHRGAELDPARYASPAFLPPGRVNIVTSDRRELKKWYRRAFQNAERRIRITSAYFLPTSGILKALMLAARRGVDVRIIVAGTTDVKPVLYAARAIYGRLLRSRVRLYEWRGRVLHAKTAVVDGHLSTVGSANLDALSLNVNLEANVVIEDEAFASQMDRMFEDDLQSCVRVRLRDWKRRPWGERILSQLAYLFRRWL